MAVAAFLARLRTMVMPKRAEEALPRRSVAEQVTFVVPTAKRVAEAGAQATGTAPSTTSAALTPYVTAAPVRLVVETRIGAGTVIAGALVSTTVTLNRFVAVFPPSLAVHVTVVGPKPKPPPEGGVHVTGIGRPSSSTAEAE